MYVFFVITISALGGAYIGYMWGYEQALDNHNILHGKAAKDFIDKANNPKPVELSREQRENLEYIILQSEWDESNKNRKKVENE